MRYLGRQLVGFADRSSTILCRRCVPLIGFQIRPAPRGEAVGARPTSCWAGLLTFGGLNTAGLLRWCCLSGKGNLPTFRQALGICLLNISGLWPGRKHSLRLPYLALVSDLTPPQGARTCAGGAVDDVSARHDRQLAVAGQLADVNYSDEQLIGILQNLALAFSHADDCVAVGPGETAVERPGSIQPAGRSARCVVAQANRCGLLARQPGMRGLFVVLFLATAAFANARRILGTVWRARC